jgi:pentafunctional AROM polypeptide
MLPKRRFFLLGHPISQSPSPAMHNAGFAKCQMPHEYVPKYIL